MKLTESERAAINDVAGCGCCSSREAMEKWMPDRCPTDDDGWVDHEYNDGCNQMASAADVAERIVAARLTAVEALADEYDRREDWRTLGIPQAIRRAAGLGRSDA